MLIEYFPVLVFATGVKLHAQTYIGLIIAQVCCSWLISNKKTNACSMYNTDSSSNVCQELNIVSSLKAFIYTIKYI